jgi:hypothetical protein
VDPRCGDGVLHVRERSRLAVVEPGCQPVGVEVDVIVAVLEQCDRAAQKCLGETCPTTRPTDPPENRPSVMTRP